MNYSQLFLVSGLLLTCLAHDINCMDEDKPLVPKYCTNEFWSTITNSTHKELEQFLKTKNEENDCRLKIKQEEEEKKKEDEQKKLEEIRRNEAWYNARKKGAIKFLVVWFNNAARENYYNREHSDILLLGTSDYDNEYIGKIYNVSDRKKRLFRLLSNTVVLSKENKETVIKLFNKEFVTAEKATKLYNDIDIDIYDLYLDEKKFRRNSAILSTLCCCIPYTLLKGFCSLPNIVENFYDRYTLTDRYIE